MSDFSASGGKDSGSPGSCFDARGDGGLGASVTRLGAGGASLSGSRVNAARGMLEPGPVPGGSLWRLITPRVGVGGGADFRETFTALGAVTSSAWGNDSRSGSDGTEARGEEPRLA